MIDRAGVDRWLDDYVAAWKSYDRDAIGALFADDVEYRYHPYDDPVRGRDSVVAAWREEAEFPGASGRDEPGIYDGSYRAVAIDGDVAVAVGQSTYTDGPDGPVAEVYDNCFLLRFDDEGRCREFTEWFVKRPLGADA
ncbi:MAG TPA: nuclear transport factor 2 family protein [Solirubrobacterales bacterium]|jgi:ketosteroid isomerase-like protein|nr:nuclear transport factor 2 family protein [Solirubrobacterales bacterium]